MEGDEGDGDMMAKSCEASGCGSESTSTVAR